MATLGTLKQSAKILSLFEDMPSDQIQAILESGFLADLRDGNVSEVDRGEFRRVLGLKPLRPELKIWKTIKLGVHKTPDAYRQSILDQKNKIYTYADQILDNVAVSSTETELDLAVLTVADLGFKRATRYDVICKRIIEVGAQLCPAEVGPALRDQYPDQPAGEYNAIATQALADLDDDLHLFSVDHVLDDRWLITCLGDFDSAWGPDLRFVVVVPRKS